MVVGRCVLGALFFWAYTIQLQEAQEGIDIEKCDKSE